ncbi:hypothetical protein AAF712_007606 [Marasmius tenuissimus]|uniref:Uncharacterized protein n=1 Tax=Marasmius tenuissimus TaxID=585030 RepID=A0ABR2ZVL5_9AGAR
MISTIFTLAATSLLATVSATPFARDAGCTPNFNGFPVAVKSSDSDASFGVGGVSTFLFQQNGKVPTSFVIKNSNDPNQAVTVVGNSLLGLQPASTTGTVGNQLFFVNCNTCGDNNGVIGGRCNLQSVSTGLCYDATVAQLKPCDVSNAAQAFDSVKAPGSGFQKRQSDVCTPVFNGEQISVLSASQDLELFVGDARHFFIQQDGKVPSKFIIKDAHDVNKAVTFVNNDLKLTPVDVTGADKSQLFNINCRACAPANPMSSHKFLAEVCSISVADGSKCLDISDSAPQPCEAKESQSFALALSH